MTVHATTTDRTATNVPDLRVQHLALEHHRIPLGIGESAPRVSWQTLAPAGWSQHGYEIRTCRRGGEETSGRIESAESVLVAWPFAPLESREQATIQIRVWGTADGDPSGWSDPLIFETGLLEPTDWTAKAVTPAWTKTTTLISPRPGSGAPSTPRQPSPPPASTSQPTDCTKSKSTATV